MLYIVATPIGNLKEITFRAVETLQNVDYIACEDTRTSQKLLNAYDIRKPLISYHKFNEAKTSQKIIEDLKSGKNIALISDAGMPAISDPGAILVSQLIANDLEYTVISGATALINAFVLSGYSSPFTFVGFIPDNNKKKNELQKELENSIFTMIFYLSPHSLQQDLDYLHSVLGDREICLVREISKKFEEVNFSKLGSEYTGTIKGEFVLLVKGKEIQSQSENIEKDIQTLLDMGISKNDASKILAKARNLKKSDIYDKTIGMK